MKIPRQLPQFENIPALFLTCGEYEAVFHITHKGEMNTKKTIKMPPREEAREKQMFTGRKAGMSDLSSMSHEGRYIADLKSKFVREINKSIHDMIQENDLDEIYLFAPKYVAKHITRELRHDDKMKIRMQFYKELTKENPIKLIEFFDKQVKEIQKDIMQNPKNMPLLH